ncbi:MAG: type II toxin-antitoxin system HicB family antitoxin [Syntrophorhabdus aromaticivorans]|uniref:Type II toxin-antitoxin system HicB family antitoxin n=2 Tax=Syntrophorhabdus aromaticivorans TaxID=328301 RepID=A0A971M571_9BACT|nr:type II toxin-antitoxin system HicB family antitoxin [Syntrophorhabdus aromaticivorans]
MRNVMTYKRYTARIEFDERDNIFIGKVIGIADSITFHGETVKELREDFQAAIDHYIADCAATGRLPLKAASGKMMLRVSPEIHARALTVAKASGKSLNQWVEEVLDKAVHQ